MNEVGNPWVTVICVCYNHARFVNAALLSVRNQTYTPIELFVVDDCSTDESATLIENFLHEHPEMNARFIRMATNSGHCKAFNTAWSQSKGEFIVDLSGDDELLPERIAKGVQLFRESDGSAGVQFGDAFLTDETGAAKGRHSDRFPHVNIPHGNVYLDVLKKYFICSPTMMLRRSVLESMNGYDESLAYEDFDLWVRASRSFSFIYTPEALVRRRVVRHSRGQQQFRRGSEQWETTFKVCVKASRLNRTRLEHEVLRRRIRYEARRALQAGEFRMAWRYFRWWISYFRLSSPVTMLM